jgi:hypothetical protein
VRVDLAFDTQQARIVVAPEDALEGWFVGVSLLMIRRQGWNMSAEGSKAIELGLVWRDRLEGRGAYLVDVAAWVWPCKFVESRNVFTRQYIDSLVFLGRI